jgi:hypothetical protein
LTENGKLRMAEFENPRRFTGIIFHSPFTIFNFSEGGKERGILLMGRVLRG